MIDNWISLLPEKCDWCPLNCGADRANGKRGLCGADDKLLVARSDLHFWEEPPISGLQGGPKRGLGPGSGTVFFSNCNMKCIYCQNYKISGVSTEVIGKEVGLENLVAEMLKLQAKGAMNINFVTGSHYRSHIITAVRDAKSKGLSLPIVWNSSGYESIASIYALSSTVDVWLPDFKYGTDDIAKLFSYNKVSNYVETTLEAIDAMLSLSGKIKFDTYQDNLRMISGIIVRHLILPGHLDNSFKALKLLYQNFGNEIKYSIMNQYTPVMDSTLDVSKSHPELLKNVSNEEYEEVLDYADSLGIENYYWQNGTTADESFIPDFVN